MKYYLATAKCGHVGKGKFYEVDFPIKAESKKEAARICIQRGKVKKHLKNAISVIVEITYEKYQEMIMDIKNNKYVHAHTKKEILDVIQLATPLTNTRKPYKNSFDSRGERISFLIKKQRIVEELAYA